LRIEAIGCIPQSRYGLDLKSPICEVSSWLAAVKAWGKEADGIEMRDANAKKLRVSMFTLVVVLACAGFAGCGGSGGGPDSSAGTDPTAAAAPQPPETDWPLFGRVLERTHFIADAPDPPFHFLWQFFAHQLIEFPPALADNVLYVVNKTGEVYAVDATTGKSHWSRNLENDVTGPTLAGGVLYVAQYGGELTALDAKTGKQKWMVKLPSHLESSPLVAGDSVYLGADSGDLYSLRTSDGKQRFKQELGSAVKASPSYHDGNVYVGDYDGNIHQLDATTGKPGWTLHGNTASGSHAGGFYASPAIAFGRLYEGNIGGTIFAVDLGSGKTVWKHETNGAIYGSPAVGPVKGLGPTVFAGSYDHHLYALEAKTGKLSWSYDVGGQIPGSPTVVGKTVYTSSFQTKKTTGLDAATGKKTFTWGSAGYDPVISDGESAFLTGFQTVWGFDAKKPK
jgi:outer membrane protein assembly factor BamB